MVPKVVWRKNAFFRLAHINTNSLFFGESLQTRASEIARISDLSAGGVKVTGGGVAKTPMRPDGVDAERVGATTICYCGHAGATTEGAFVDIDAGAVGAELKSGVTNAIETGIEIGAGGMRRTLLAI